MKTLPLMALAGLILFSTAHADVPVPKADPEAEAARTRMDSRLSHARTMTFTVTLTGAGTFTGTRTFTGTGLEAGPPLTITGQCEKPNKLVLEFRRHGVKFAEAYSDGHVQFLYDPQAHRYLRHALGYGPNLTNLAGGFVTTIPKGRTDATSTMRLPANLFGGDAFDLLTSLSQVKAYLLFFDYRDLLNPNEPLPPPPPAQPSDMFDGAISDAVAAFAERYTSCTRESLDGQAVLHLRGHYVSTPVRGEKQIPLAAYGMEDLGSIEWCLDATTGLPRRWTETHAGSFRGSKLPTSRSEEDYSAMQAGDTPLPPATFAWTPPPGARLIHLEKIPPPSP